MNKGILLIGIIVMALFGFVAINLVTSQQTGAELDYYLLKETTDAAMHDALDNDYYSHNGVVRMDKEKFVESFLRRFAEGVDPGRDYDIKFYDINEVPPKVSVMVNSGSNFMNKDEKTNISTKVDMIIESNTKTDAWAKNYIDGTTSSARIRDLEKEKK